MIAMEAFFSHEAWDRLVGQLERLPHALLLHGPQGIGKLHLAERFAQLLLCEARGRATVPCGRCDGCRWFLAGQHPDVRFIEPETISRQVTREDSEDAEKPKGKPSSEIKIEQIRRLADFLYIGSHRGGRRIAIVHPAESMNAHASNALLKSLEEPPAGAVFLLVSHRPARLLPTIRSRCVPAPVCLPDAGAAQAWLHEQGVPEGGRRLAFAGGAPLRALEDSSSERGVRADEIVRAVASRDMTALRSPKDREGLELLAEVLQKCAFDRALASLGVPPKYTSGMASARSECREWLAYTRKLGRDRALARHPVNVALHAAEMLAGLPAK